MENYDLNMCFLHSNNFLLLFQVNEGLSDVEMKGREPVSIQIYYVNTEVKINKNI